MSNSMQFLVTEAIRRVQSAGLVLLVDDETRRIACELNENDASHHQMIATMLTTAACQEGVGMRLERNVSTLTTSSLPVR
ncbi:hypothetical protein [Fulvimarina sp. MAC8]|uniref:hypothetical protein n=1 Tax=Fulvimarina sp. MAC8 TaxID=3162874 RepID=UPI0032EB57AD